MATVKVYKCCVHCFCGCGYTDLNWYLMIMLMMPSITFSLLFRRRRARKRREIQELVSLDKDPEGRVSG